MWGTLGKLNFLINMAIKFIFYIVVSPFTVIVKVKIAGYGIESETETLYPLLDLNQNPFKAMA